MTHDELQAIKARAEAATLDPWLPGAMTVAEALEQARTDVPALIAEVERLQKVHADLEAENCRLRQQHDRDWETNADLRQEIERLHGELRQWREWVDEQFGARLDPDDPDVPNTDESLRSLASAIINE